MESEMSGTKKAVEAGDKVVRVKLDDIIIPEDKTHPLYDSTYKETLEAPFVESIRKDGVEQNICLDVS